MSEHRRKIVLFTWGSVVACVLSLALFGWGFTQRASVVADVEALATQTNQALCTFYEDLERRYNAGLEFYQRHPEGIPGVSAADIARSLAGQKATLDSLASLKCP